MNNVKARLLSIWQTACEDRGDVPGWVLVTLMTAGLVTSIWLLADGQLNDILNRALASVHA